MEHISLIVIWKIAKLPQVIRIKTDLAGSEFLLILSNIYIWLMGLDA
ncbi:MAG: hypothetical protein K8F52_08580 [Candidatus Scalindua rubra]|nr:hypothetical protein [Candidatus Scalindua rubra]